MFANQAGQPVLMKMVHEIQANKAYLGEVDGLIGDGDHGANMNKGFTMFGEQIADKGICFTDGLTMLGTLLMDEIGGSMGPIYGTIFIEMASAGDGADEITPELFLEMLRQGLEGLYEIVDARVGDKTLVDTLVPAIDAFDQAVQDGCAFPDALAKLKQAAVAGCASTKNLQAKYGRSARLAERSIGVPDAGATSCRMLLCAMADGINEQWEA